MNRVAVDSLYRESGNLSSFTKNEIRTFALILHHSDDCEWNRKWTKIFFSELKSENLKSVPLLVLLWKECLVLKRVFVLIGNQKSQHIFWINFVKSIQSCTKNILGRICLEASCIIITVLNYLQKTPEEITSL